MDAMSKVEKPPFVHAYSTSSKTITARINYLILIIGFRLNYHLISLKAFLMLLGSVAVEVFLSPCEEGASTPLQSLRTSAA
jgi:hypothetical protein